MRSVLIANRGEIAVRIARSARRLGITTIAIASDADRNAPHTHACDQSVPIGGDAPADTYLRIDKILAAACASRAQAVHPGYGFLAENATFARAVIEAGLVWIGPPPEAMDAMADKSRARARMAARGVPVLPGHDSDDQTRATLRAAARRIGAPLMVKARAGGGGRGMRLVSELAQLDAALDSAVAEAQAAFGDGCVLLERALVDARHVELQVFADAAGSVIHLGERDCSVQRRHQKLVEEAPSPAVTPALRRQMGDAAVAVAREIGYVGAGTVEFLLDADGRFWFMEMNTRLQVEHAVTEALLGIDLVEWQFAVAAGAALPLTQDETLARHERGGHAIEVRLCAEDPAHGDLPQSGRIGLWQAPEGVRCDHALGSGTTVSPFYDSMLAKLIAHAPTRAAALERLAGALDRTACLGVSTNRGFLASVLRHPVFAAGRATTAFLGDHFADAASRLQPASSALEALAAAAQALLPERALPAVWTGWSTTAVVDTESPLRCGEALRRWRLYGTPQDLVASCDGRSHRIAGLARLASTMVQAIGDDRPITARVVHDGPRSLWLAEGHELEVIDLRLGSAGSATGFTDTDIRAPMHGRVTQVLVAAGAAVEAGALLIVMEAMKMEHQLRAPRGGVITALRAHVGQQVAARDVLVEMET